MEAEIVMKKERRSVSNLINVQLYYERVIKTQDNGQERELCVVCVRQTYGKGYLLRLAQPV
jgi:hypothetical protein